MGGWKVGGKRGGGGSCGEGDGVARRGWGESVEEDVRWGGGLGYVGKAMERV